MADDDAAVRERAIHLAGDFYQKHPLPAEARAALILAAKSADARLRFATALTLARLTGPQTPSDIADTLVALARKEHAHTWIGPAILSAHPDFLSHQLLPALAVDDFAPQAEAFLAQLIYTRAKSQPEADRPAQVDLVIRLGTRPAHLVALSKGLPPIASALEKADVSGKLTKVFTEAGLIANDSKQTTERRSAALALLAAAPIKLSRPILTACLAADRPAEIQAEAIAQWGLSGDKSFAFAVIAAWEGLAPSVKPKAIAQLLQRPAYLPPLLDALGTKKLPATALDAGQVQSLLKLKDAKLALEARKVLADVIPPSRDVVTAKFAASLDLAGDTLRGQAVYQRACVICHRAAGQGMEVGPDLLTVKNKGRAALLTAILDPNKEVAAQYMSFLVQTRAGESYLGVIAEDTATQVTLKMPGGVTKTILRSDVIGSSSEGRSLMPEGLEGGLTNQDMADLLTFIESLK
jgi:putative heme-binding domain-containing protein